MKVGVVVFPGSNCDRDCGQAIAKVTGAEIRYLWHKTADLQGCDAIVLPGGFSYGDYLRCGAIASHSPIMQEVKAAAGKGVPVLGICNGFQILTESGLLPGVLMRNRSLNFICETVTLKLENTKTPFTRKAKAGSISRIPIAHMEGNYFADAETFKALEAEGQIVFRYCDDKGQVTDAANPNGAMGNIAGICNKAGNVLGMMPHPERVCEEILGGTDGAILFKSLLG